MNTHYCAVVKQDFGWWIGWIEEISEINCQQQTRAGLVESLRVTLREAMEINRSDAIKAAGVGYEERSITI